jgi:hypothetical protein
MKWLGEVVHRAFGQAGHRRLDVSHRRDEDHDGVRIRRPDVPQQADAIDFRHLKVRQDDGGRLPFKHFLRDAPVLGLFTHEAFGAHEPAQQPPQVRFVINHQATHGPKSVERNRVAFSPRRFCPQCHSIFPADV